MIRKTTEQAYAKINLYLDVTGRRENGYHEIDGVMQSVSLCDDVEVAFESAEETQIVLHAEGNPDMPTDRSNLAVRAAELFLRAADLAGYVEIQLKKRIPMAGGLAGGSTDAAAVLRALNRLTGSPVDLESLCALGAKLGADVPFCICGGAMRTQGIGEILTPCPGLPEECAIVIARKGEGISTPWAYGQLDELYGGFVTPRGQSDEKLRNLLDALEKKSMPGICACVENIFEQVAVTCRPEVVALREQMLAGRALVSRMSGSGTAVFGIFESDADAGAVCDALRQYGAVAHVCHPVAGEIL